MRSIMILSSSVGLHSGPSKTTLLLAETLRAVGNRVTLVVTTPSLPRVDVRLAKAGVRKIYLPLRGYRWRLPGLLSAILARALAMFDQPDVTILLGPSYEAKVYLRICFNRSRIIYWETSEACPESKFFDPSFEGMLNGVGCALTPTHTIAKNVKQFYRYSGPISLLPFWIDEPGYTAVATQRFSLLYVGRIDSEKGLTTLLMAFREAQQNIPLLTLNVYGPGSPDFIPKELRDCRGVRFHGPVDGVEIDACFAACDVFVLPSYSEGYPLVLLESCARGRPFIATSVGSIPEVFSNQAFAKVIRPRDVAELRDAIERLYRMTPSEIESLGRAARHFHEQVLSEQKIRPVLGGIIDNVISPASLEHHK